MKLIILVNITTVG